MSIKITIDTASQLRQQFVNCNRDNFSMSGYQALLDYYDDGDDQELDVVAICCDWNELDIDSIASEYSIDLSDITDNNGDVDENEKSELVMEYLNDRTYAIDCGNSILFQAF